MADAKTLDDLFLDTLKDIYFAEKQIVKALPKMAKAASSPHLTKAFEDHLKETEGHVERLETIFGMLKTPAQGKTCKAIQGILDEGKELMDEFAGTPALDAALVSAAQAVEHYEIARYGTLKAWARLLDLKDVVGLLEKTEREEMAADKKLTELGVGEVNQRAAA
jgi:ferritin-like metal-binding protein YciE